MGSTENFCLRWNDFESNVSGAFRDLRAEADFFDVTLGCTDSNGRSLQAHKVILSACSSFFKNLLRQQQATQNSHPNPFIYLRGVSFSDLSSVLDFMYHGEVNVAQEDLNSFLAVAEELQIKGLTNKDGRPSSGEPSKDRKSHTGPGRPGGGGPPPKRQRRSSPPPNSVTSNLQSTKSNISSGDIRQADIKSDPESLVAGPSSSGHLNSDGQAVTDFEDGDNQGEFDESYQDDYYNDNGGEGGEAMLGDDMAGSGGGDGSEEGTTKGEVVLRGGLKTQHQGYNPMNILDDTLDDDDEEEEGLDDDSPGALLASSDIEAVFGDHLGDLAPMENGGQKCLICEKTFTQLGSAKRHVIEVHKPGQQVSCHICHKIFSNSRSGKEHMRVKHGISQKMINLQKKFTY